AYPLRKSPVAQKGNACDPSWKPCRQVQDRPFGRRSLLPCDSNVTSGRLTIASQHPIRRRAPVFLAERPPIPRLHHSPKGFEHHCLQEGKLTRLANLLLKARQPHGSVVMNRRDRDIPSRNAESLGDIPPQESLGSQAGTRIR